MITLHAFANMFPGGVGETKDMRIQWALEEMELPYEVRAWDYLGGETNGPEFLKISPFRQIPVLEHDGMVLAESAAILIHLAEVSGRLTPPDAEGRLHVMQWCFAAATTFAWPISSIAMIDAGLMGTDPATRTFAVELAHRWLDGLERRLAGEEGRRDWIAGDEFSVADIVLAHVLREARETDLMDGFPAVRSFYDRALARPAWQRTRELTAERMNVDVAEIA